MRVVALLLLLATAFGAAALWQSRRVEALEAEREHARQLEAGELAEGPHGTIPAGWAHVVIGGPTAVEPVPQLKIRMISEARIVVPEVITVRESVWLIETSQTSARVPFTRGRFSRMRSNTTIVSFSE
jgi:hypothetical protein